MTPIFAVRLHCLAYRFAPQFTTDIYTSTSQTHHCFVQGTVDAFTSEFPPHNNKHLLSKSGSSSTTLFIITLSTYSSMFPVFRVQRWTVDSSHLSVMSNLLQCTAGSLLCLFTSRVSVCCYSLASPLRALMKVTASSIPPTPPTPADLWLCSDRESLWRGTSPRCRWICCCTKGKKKRLSPVKLPLPASVTPR